ncbi:response regulator transcription factor [Siphonobacter aquaeclarae]|jgi:DNA-binding NarL/FixJ family response regulator|uniref:Two component transcriptional regulator, LuxR family n=1 Tax=Siphonobacter aquaeclarae TaxID=563176 RepID=A0A1G9Q6U1_9BACT|nr:response regulator transcription factor [Siphonobacter aquaeclarae]MBO9636680.1 response regulator transcription factor [Siphonobacter aquaeclarae]SDM06659.1 two component transcriptional regulator, LuxR family [Siphonobacter aquaeclarae]
MGKIRVLVADDHAVVRKGIRMLLEDEDSVEIVGEAADGQEAIDRIPETKPDVVMLDITMPNVSGIEAAKTIAQQYSSVKSLIFSMHNNQDYILKSVESGASGYLLKDTTKEEILLALQKVSQGEKYFPPTISSVFVDALLGRSRGRAASRGGDDSPLSKLSRKERQILSMIAEGLNSREIAEKLGLSIRTVTNHRANMLRKTKVKNTVELVRIAVEEKKA